MNTAIVKDENRADYLYRKIGKHFINFEMAVYNFQSRFDYNYQGGYWDFVEFEDGSFFLRLATDKPVSLVFDNGVDEDFSADVAGMIVTLYALNQLCWTHPSDHHNKLYYDLRNACSEHPEANAIYRAID